MSEPVTFDPVALDAVARILAAWPPMTPGQRYTLGDDPTVHTFGPADAERLAAARAEIESLLVERDAARREADEARREAACLRWAMARASWARNYGLSPVPEGPNLLSSATAVGACRSCGGLVDATGGPAVPDLVRDALFASVRPEPTGVGLESPPVVRFVRAAFDRGVEAGRRQVYAESLAMDEPPRLERSPNPIGTDPFFEPRIP